MKEGWHKIKTYFLYMKSGIDWMNVFSLDRTIHGRRVLGSGRSRLLRENVSATVLCRGLTFFIHRL